MTIKYKTYVPNEIEDLYMFLIWLQEKMNQNL